MPDQGIRSLLKHKCESFASEQVKPQALCSPSFAPKEDRVKFYSQSLRSKNEVIRKYCHACPLARQCLEIAFIYSDKDGVWGGTVEATRTAILSRIRRDLQIPGMVRWNEETWAKLQEYIDLLFVSEEIPFNNKGKPRSKKGRPNPMYNYNSQDTASDELQTIS
jgi:hypothetical protein